MMFIVIRQNASPKTATHDRGDSRTVEKMKADIAQSEDIKWRIRYMMKIALCNRSKFYFRNGSKVILSAYPALSCNDFALLSSYISTSHWLTFYQPIILLTISVFRNAISGLLIVILKNITTDCQLWLPTKTLNFVAIETLNWFSSISVTKIICSCFFLAKKLTRDRQMKLLNLKCP